MIELGRAAYFRAEYDSAEALWDSALEKARSSQDSLSEVVALTWLGHRARKQSEYEIT